MRRVIKIPIKFILPSFAKNTKFGFQFLQFVTFFTELCLGNQFFLSGRFQFNRFLFDFLLHMFNLFTIFGLDFSYQIFRRSRISASLWTTRSRHMSHTRIYWEFISSRICLIQFNTTWSHVLNVLGIHCRIKPNIWCGQFKWTKTSTNVVNICINLLKISLVWIHRKRWYWKKFKSLYKAKLTFTAAVNWGINEFRRLSGVCFEYRKHEATPIVAYLWSPKKRTLICWPLMDINLAGQ